MVPSSAVVNTADGVAVFAQPAEGQTFDNAQPIPEGAEVPEGFVLVPVEVGISDAENTEILSGLDEGTTVFLAGPRTFTTWIPRRPPSDKGAALCSSADAARCRHLTVRCSSTYNT